ncbi:MFS transporter [Sphingosinicella terrae]|jgi:MFS transporter, ACS family, hexuronate transporter|uniref:MFS transporter n=1 Tax=Sphingosinicella terrae TaxID=2172047 RepID=UPI000E0DE206|nr:MFS transporter [Sphingosinicella terrae]
MASSSSEGASATSGGWSVGRVRWGICALLFFATTINYIDRQMISVLKPTLQAEYGWSETTYANIVFSFQAAYAIGYFIFGHLMDRLGARFGYSLAAVIWGIAAMAHAGARGALDFMIARFALGLGESGNFPAGVKAVSEWFPARERALAIGIFNAGANIGAILTPLIAPILVLAFGWRAAFLFTGAIVFVWVAIWWTVYRRPREKKNLSVAELAWIESDPADPPGKVPWLSLLRHRQTWAYAVGKFMIDPIWWFFLFWLPSFFQTEHGLNLMTFGPPLVAIYIISDVGSVFGGWLSSALMKRGWSANAGRKTAMLVCALMVPPVILAPGIDSLWGAVLLIGLATAAHQGFSANLYTLPSDLFPRKAVGAIIGIGGTLGAVGGMFMAKFTGWVLDSTGSYMPMFIVAGSTYLLALLVIHLLVPKLEPAKVV